ncbi:hypothetical protein E0W58_06545, partial [Neisseria meningitidis]|nr:hypothetical protein [Neisseria meningitidis]
MPSEALFALRTASPLRANGLNARNGFRPFFRPKPFYSGLTKSGQGDEAADSTNSTEPIHLVLQHLRE